MKNDLVIMNLKYKGTRDLLEFSPKIVLLGIFLLIILLSSIGKISLVYRGLYILIPIAIASIYLLINGDELNDISANRVNNVQSHIQKKIASLSLFIFFYLVSVILLLTSDVREKLYFITIAILGLIIFIQILNMDLHKYSKYVILLEIILCSINLSFGLTLKYPLYYGSDLLIHFSYIQTIIEHGFITDRMGDYRYFPLYHILTSMGAILLNVEQSKSVFIVAGIAYQSVILFTYKIVEKISHEKIALLSVLILSYSRDYIYYGEYLVTRSMAFVFFIIFLYILYVSKDAIKNRFLLLFTLMSLILVHQVSMLYILIILIAIAGIEKFYYHFYIISTKMISNSIIVTMLVFFIAYWLYLADTFFVYFIEAFSQSSDVIASSTEMVQYVTSANVLSTSLNNIDGGILLFFILIGIYYIFHKKEPGYPLVLATFGLITISLYIRSPLYLIPAFTKIFVAQRIAILLSPLMSFLGAYGVYRLISSKMNSKWSYRMGLYCLVILFIFTSISNSFTAQDNPLSGQKQEIPTPYFTENDLQLRSFMENIDFANIYVDGIIDRSFPYKINVNSLAKENNSLVVYGDSFIIIRYKELKERTIRLTTGNKSMWDPEISYATYSNLDLSAIHDLNMIYDSYDSKIYSS